MNPNSLQDSIADVCSGLGYPLVHLVNYPVTTLVSFRSKVDGPFDAKPDKEKEWNDERMTLGSTAAKVGINNTGKYKQR